MPKSWYRWVLLLGCCPWIGCTSYEERPLDLPQYEQVFAARPEAAARTAAIEIEDGLTRDEGEVLALLFDARLREARAQAAGALELVEYAGVWADPELGLELGRVREDISKPFYGDVRIGFTIPLSGRLGAEEAAARAGAEEELQRVLSAEWHVRMELRRSWCSYSAARGRQAILDELVHAFDVRLQRLQDPAWRAEFDALSIGTWELSAVEQRLQQARNAREILRLRSELLERMGLAPEFDGELHVDWRGSELPEDEGRVAILESQNPELSIQRAIYAKSERELELAVREQYPDLRMGPIYQSDTGLDRLLMGMWLPLPVWNGNGLAIAAASAERERARAAFEGAWERARHALVRAERELAGARADRSFLEREWMPRLRAQEERIQARARSGALDPFAELELLVALAQVKLREVDLRCAEAEAEVRVHTVLGPKKAAQESAAENP